MDWLPQEFSYFRYLSRQQLKTFIDGVERAAQVLRGYQLQIRALSTAQKQDGSLVSDADYASNKILCELVKEVLPHSQIISEEGSSTPATNIATPIWIIDPLDGTKIFLAGKKEYSIQVALFADDTYQLGIMVYPGRGDFIIGINGVGAFLNGARLFVNSTEGVSEKSIYSRKGPASLQPYQIAEDLDSGDAFYHVATGKLKGVYIEAGNLSLWDVAASSVVIKEAGGQTNLHVHGLPTDVPSPLKYPFIAGQQVAFDKMCQMMESVKPG